MSLDMDVIKAAVFPATNSGAVIIAKDTLRSRPKHELSTMNQN